MLAYREHRARRAPNDVLGDAAGQQTVQTGPAPGPQDDQVSAVVYRCLDDLLRGIPASYFQRRSYVLHAHLVSDSNQSATGIGVQAVPTRRRIGKMEFVRAGRPVGLLEDVNEVYFRVYASGHCAGEVDEPARVGGEIDGNENVSNRHIHLPLKIRKAKMM